MAELTRIKVACLAMDGVEELELTEPVKALRDTGAEVTIFSPDGKDIQAMRNDEKTIRLAVDESLHNVRADDFQALFLPGGALNADRLRRVEEARQLVRRIESAGKTLAVICHAPWVLVSSGVVQGRTLTSYFTVQDDIRNAGGTWFDQEVVIDRNWITSRSPRDLPAFNAAIIQALAESRVSA